MADNDSDHYQHSSELYDLLSESHWNARNPSMRSLLASLGSDRKKALDIGAGTGRGTVLLAEAFPQSKIIAVEPSAGMRAALMTRIFMTPGLRDAVTVAPFTFQDAPLRPEFDIILACGCIGYFDASARSGFWNRLSSLLARDGVALVDTMPIDRPAHVEEHLVAQSSIGTYRYDIWLSGTPGESDVMHWHMRFEIHDGDTLVRKFAVDRPWHVLNLDQLGEEAAQAGLVTQRMPDGPTPGLLIHQGF